MRPVSLCHMYSKEKPKRRHWLGAKLNAYFIEDADFTKAKGQEAKQSIYKKCMKDLTTETINRQGTIKQ